MPNATLQPDAKQLLDALNAKGFNTDDNLASFMIQQHNEYLPLSFKIMIGVGALMAALFFFGFLHAINAINYEHNIALISWGLAFILGAIALPYCFQKNHTVLHCFFVQCSFALMIVGKILFIMGIADTFYINWDIALACLFITAVTYPLYTASIDRFLSSFATLVLITGTILFSDNHGPWRELFFNIFFFSQLVGLLFLVLQRKVSHYWTPIEYAITCSLCVSILFLTSHAEFGYWPYETIIHPSFITLLLTGGLIALFIWLAGGTHCLQHESFRVATATVVILGLCSTPGILLTMALLILGYAKHENLFIVLGACLMPTFLFLYYYNLDADLIHKAAVLIGSGLILLIARAYLRFRRWDQGGDTCALK